MRCAKCNHLKVAEGRRFYCNVCAPLAKAEAQERAMERFMQKHPDYWVEYYQRRKA